LLPGTNRTDVLEGYLDDPERIAQLIREAAAAGFQFDD
jgi:hypothetical protein